MFARFILLSLTAGLPLTIWVFRRKWRERRAGFLSSRFGISDSRFVDELGLGAEYGGIDVLIRRVIAGMCGVPPEMILPSDDTSELSRLMFLSDGWDPSEFALLFNIESGVEWEWDRNALNRLPPFLSYASWRRKIDGPEDLGAWIVQTTRCLSQRVPDWYPKPYKGVWNPWDDWVP